MTFSNAITAFKNGYAYVYFTNESDELVYFDNFYLSHERGRILEETHYYPFGLSMTGINSKAAAFGQPSNKLKYNGKEEQRQEFSDGSGLEWLDYGARMYDNQLGRWFNEDARADKFLALSPFDYVGGNPIKRVDPNGMDWYRDDKGTLQYDPKVQSQKDLKDGQKYVGDTYQEKNKKGKVTANYRADGSIMFSKQKDAYNRMYNNSKANGNREEFGVITKKGVLVTPDYKNTAGESSPTKYGYTFKNGNIVDPLTNSQISTVATIHTHLSPGGDPMPSFTDQENLSLNTPNKPFLTFGNDGNIYGNYGTWPVGTDGKYHTSDIKTYNINFKYYGINNSSILNGFDLSGFLQEYMQKVTQ